MCIRHYATAEILIVTAIMDLTPTPEILAPN